MKLITSIIRQHRSQAVATKADAGCNKSQCNYANNYYGDQICQPYTAANQRNTRA